MIVLPTTVPTRDRRLPFFQHGRVRRPTTARSRHASRSAIHAADHLPDLELGPCAAAAAHRWDHPEDRAAVRSVDSAEVAPADRAEGPARASAHLDFGPQKHSLLLP
jgi:hypothetical protein